MENTLGLLIISVVVEKLQYNAWKETTQEQGPASHIKKST